MLFSNFSKTIVQTEKQTLQDGPLTQYRTDGASLILYDLFRSLVCKFSSLKLFEGDGWLAFEGTGLSTYFIIPTVFLLEPLYQLTQ